MALIILERLENQKNPNSTTTRNYMCHLVKCSGCNSVYKYFGNPYKYEFCKTCGNKKAGNTRRKYTKSEKRFDNIYRSMKDRCYNPNNTSYSLYGAKGVTICEEWLTDKKAFLSWAESTYVEGYELDKDFLCEKLNVYPKMYSSQTCRWIPKSTNANTNIRGKSKASKLTSNEVKDIYEKYTSKCQTAKQLAEQYNVDITTIYWNVKRYRARINDPS